MKEKSKRSYSAERNNKMPSYQEQLVKLITKARKSKNFLAVLYYSQNISGIACVSWERFKVSWVGQKWVIAHQPAADAMTAKYGLP